MSNEQAGIPIEQTAAEVQSAVVPIMERAQSLKVVDAASYGDAVAYLQTIKGTIKSVTAQFDPAVKAAKAAHTSILAMRDKILLPLEQQENLLKITALTWKQSEDRKAAEEQARLQRIADEQAAKERAKLEARVAACKTEAKREELLQRSAEIVAPVVSVQSSAPEVKGAATVTRWKYRIVNAELIPREWLIADDEKLSKIATAMKGEMKIAGVEFYKDTIMSVRTKGI